MGAGHVFVSYSSTDRPFADELVRVLEAAPLRIWYAPRDVRPGVDYSEQIQKAIETAVAFVIIVSEAANKSRFVRAETEMAFSRGQPIFPVRTSPIVPASGLALFLQLRHWTDVFGHSQKRAVARLTDELVAATQSRGQGTTGGPTLFHPNLRRLAQGLSPKPLRGRRAYVTLAAVGVLCLVLAVVIALRGETRAGAESNQAVQGNSLIAGQLPRAPPDPSDPNYEQLRERWDEYIRRTSEPFPMQDDDLNLVDLQMSTNTTAATESNDLSSSAENSASIEVNGM